MHRVTLTGQTVAFARLAQLHAVHATRSKIVRPVLLGKPTFFERGRGDFGNRTATNIDGGQQPKGQAVHLRPIDQRHTVAGCHDRAARGAGPQFVIFFFFRATLLRFKLPEI